MNAGPSHPAAVTALIRIGVALAVVAALTACTTLSGYRNPRVTVEIDHPADIGVHVAEVAFAPSQGRCAAALASGLQGALRSAGVGVSRVGAWTAGSATGAPESPAGSGRLVVSLGQTECRANRSHTTGRKEKERKKTRTGADGKEEEYKEKYYVDTYKGTTEVTLRMWAQAHDRETGRRVGEITPGATESAEEEGESLSYPPIGPLSDRATERVSEKLSRWLLPWTERATLVFYDAHECGMATTHAFVAEDDPVAALAAARDSVALCEREEDGRFRAAARYNAGMVHFLQGNPREALRMLDAAVALDPDNAHAPKARDAAARAIESLDALERIRADAASIAASAGEDGRQFADTAGAADRAAVSVPPGPSAGRAAARGAGTPGRVTIAESEGPTEGSLVTLVFGPGAAVPAVGATGSLSVPTTMSLFEGAGTIEVMLGAGECEVVSAAGNVVTVRIIEAGGRITDKSDGSVQYALPRAGAEIVFEPHG